MTVQAKLSTVAAPLSSVAVTVTSYGPPAEARGSIMPLINPVRGSIANPAGRPLAA